ncbi:MAG: iron-containing alcohol dehydrogenase [Chlorobium sp.]|nr:iron-containing alcohol dehydrogenase [Chlorobium phaeovibrioides]NQU46861.1 iron-containing alcohol dehydrogenase [Chlorobium sp.]
MNFFLTTDLVVGVNEALNLTNHLGELKSRRPGVIYDGVLEETPYFRDVKAAFLAGSPNAFFYCNEFKREPTYRHLENTAEHFRGIGVDCIVAIGGGSTMDLGKGVALLMTNNVPALSLKGFPSDVHDPLPLITVPSLPGSGAEVSYNAVFIDEDAGRKLGINSRKNFPKKAVVDPMLSMSAPLEAIVSSAMDSLVHCVDSFGSVKHTPLSRVFSVEGFRRSFYALQQNQLDRAESRIDLCLGSVCGTVALMNSGDGPTNGFAYYLGVRHKVPHGMAGAIFLKEVMRYNLTNGYDRYASLNAAPLKGTLREGAEELLSEMDDLYHQLAIPNLVPYGYSSANATEFAGEASGALQGSFGGNPIPFDKESAEYVVKRLVQ